VEFKMPDAWKTWEGQSVDGFQLRQYLGGSDHSAVYLTNLHSAGEPSAAIKFVRASDDADVQLERWRVAGLLNHPNLLSLYGLGRCQVGSTGLLYVVMEHAEEDLSQILPQRTLEPEEMRQMLSAVLEGVSFLHSQGLAHTRLKPANILAAGDQLKISRDTICEIGSKPLLHSELGIHDAPEFGSLPVSAAGDVWSLGVTVVEALTQRTPVVRNENRVEVPLPETVPPPYLEIARRSVQLDPARRASLREISALLNPGVQPKRDPMLAPANERVIPAEPIKQSLAAQHVAVTPHTLMPAAAASTTLSQPPAKRSNVALYLVGIPMLVVVILLLPKLANRFSQLQPHADTVRTTIKPASEMLDPPASVAKRQKEIADAAAVKTPAPTTAEKPPAGAPVNSAASSLLLKTPKDSAASGTAASSGATSANAAPRVTGATVGHGAVLYQVVPDVSEQARQTILGTVTVNVRIKVDATGNVTSAALESDNNKFFGAQAVEVANRWIFRPPQVDGQNSASEWLLHFEFTPTSTKVFPAQMTP
jgi:TonB family protein